MDKYSYIKGNHRRVLKYLIRWIQSSKHPKTKIINNQICYWFSLQKIADDLDLSYYQVKTILYRLENKDKSINYKNNEPFLYAEMIYSRSETNKLYLRLNEKVISELFENVKIKEQKMTEPLFDYDERPKVNENADKIARKILAENSDVFRTRAGNTKTYHNCCKIITDIYNGAFGGNPHLYSLSKISECKWFDTLDWKVKLRKVKGDWNAVENLLSQSVKNFRLMFDEKNMPQNKKYLPNDFERWLYDSNNVDYPSYLIFSFNEPNITMKQYGENRADTLFKLLPRKMQDAGNKLVDILPKGTYPSILWNNIVNMWVWAKYMLEADENADYWLKDSADILNEFMDYCDEKNIQISLSTLNIEKAVDCNSPWVWFVQDATSKHGLKQNLCDCVNKDDFEKLYHKKIYFELVA